MQEKLKDYCELLSSKEKEFFTKIYVHLVSLGYRPGKEKKQSVSYNFVHKTVKKSIIKFSSERQVPFLKIKFFAAQDYSGYFCRALRNTIEEFNFKYTGCYKCGRCKNKPQGYQVHYDDGRTFFRCGFELIELHDLNTLINDNNLIQEIKNMISIQHVYYIQNRGYTVIDRRVETEDSIVDED